MNAHSYTVVNDKWWNAYVAKCGCGWVGQYELTRPAAIRHHTMHVHSIGIYA